MVLSSHGNACVIRQSYFSNVQEEVFLLNIDCPDPSVQLAITRLATKSPETTQLGPPVVLLHGSFCNRSFWLSKNGHGLAMFLAQQGYEVWLPEMRGHGFSPKNQTYEQNTMSAYVRFDLPQIAHFIYQQNPQSAHWLGHSLGGISLSALLAEQRVPAHYFLTLTLLGTQVSYFNPCLRIPFMWRILKKYYLSRWLHNAENKEHEPKALLIEFLRWFSIAGGFKTKDLHWWKALKTVTIPLLSIAAAQDQGDPPHACFKLFKQFSSTKKIFITLGKEQGYLIDYNHTDMLIGRSAKKEVWPLLALWMAENETKSA
ncbi:alpha/beta hydrolase [Pseudomonas sp. F1_0610]|uniref:alpha/beta fold hydrolase n=1 Tax=Pseudomonas sp. F1_0610 TaxID=3114284 RepID=UPI0039C2D17C